jgi:DNA repair exonuclease SbcCD ATPase subunit
MNTKMEKSSKFTALVITSVLAFVMLTSTSYLYFDNSKLSDLNTSQKSQIEYLVKEKNDIISQLTEANKSIEDYKGRNNELQQLYKKSRTEIVTRDRRIEKLIRNNSGYNKIQKEVIELRKYKSVLIERIKELEYKSNVLLTENNALRKERNDYKKALEELQVRFDVLGKKIELASELRADHIFIIPSQKLKNVNPTQSRKIRRSDKLFLVCKITENKVADKGEKTIYIRIIDPKGVLVEGAEAGAFMNKDQNLSVPFTKQETIDYNNYDLNVKIPISLNNKALPKGSYRVEMYCDGHFCGGSKFNLK